MEDDLNFIKMEDNFIFFQMEDDFNSPEKKMTLTFSEIEDNLNIFKNGRQPQYFQKWKMTYTF